MCDTKCCDRLTDEQSDGWTEPQGHNYICWWTFLLSFVTLDHILLEICPPQYFVADGRMNSQMERLNPRCTTTHAGEHSCNVLWIWLIHFWRYAPHKIAYSVGYILTKSRVITFHLLVAAKHETPGAQLHMLVNIPVKFNESGSYTFGDMPHTRLHTL